MFKPKYTVTSRLLANIKRIAELVTELNHREFPQPVLAEFEKNANAVSAHSSTSIEGNPLPLTDVKRLIKTQPKNIRDSEQEIINYNQALIYLKTQSHKKLNLSLILEIQKLVMTKLMPKTKTGKLRKEPVFVNNPRTGKTIYWPPDHADATTLTNELIDYISKSGIDPIILSGIFHKQFVIIHPFIDGNGRTTRLITKQLLANMGLNTFNLFSFENYYNRNVSKYFEQVGLRGNYYDLKNSIDFTEWLEYFSDGIIDELLRVSKELARITISPDTSLAKHHQAIIKYIEKHGYINDKLYATVTERAKATRSQDFKHLLELKLIERFGKGRATYYKLTKSPVSS
jgi:Fic family protein